VHDGDAPLVSVLTPSFNQARWLADNLRSVAEQTYPHVEHVVMDGGSTDGSVEVLRRAPGNVRWRSEKDGGQAEAINKAFAESRGEIIGWLNSDDAYFSPSAVADAVAAFRDEGVGVVYGHAAIVNADGLILQAVWVPRFRHALFRRYDFLIQPAVFVRRAVLGERMVDERYDYTMDYELWLRLAERHRFVRLDRILAVDRHYPMRKAYSRLDLLERDQVRLRAEHGILDGPATRIAVKPLKVLFRLMGLRLLSECSGRLAFAGKRDGSWRLLARQLAVRRMAMPVGRT
jgi:glycosyltransferase involved in cell wall biosynthesis